MLRFIATISHCSLGVCEPAGREPAERNVANEMISVEVLDVIAQAACFGENLHMTLRLYCTLATLYVAGQVHP